jgi:hypothetical protein
MLMGMAAGVCLIGMIAAVDMLRADQIDGIQFSHPVHAEQDLDCSTCHEGIETSQSALDGFLPAKDTCESCHDVEDTDECGVCHTNPEDPTGYGPRPVVAAHFSHQAHVDGGMACETCHGPSALGEPHLPAKSQCRTCHETASYLTDCRYCHGEMEPLIPFTHVKQWYWLHGVDARISEESCANCHTQIDCQDCHTGNNVRPRSHTLNYAFNHALDARGREMQCATCHQEPGFCQACHIAEGVLPTDHSQAGWIGAGGGQHAIEARFDIESCVACHDQGADDPNCARCHGR